MSDESCAVCGSGDTNGTGMSRVVIQGRSLALCRTHASTVVMALPKTFDDLRALFAETSLDSPRSPIDRRSVFDRREFPPRPEGRRLGLGRRAADPSE